MKTAKKVSGQSLVEFALLFPLLIFLVMGLFDIGRAVLYYAILNTAAREGTRFAIVQPAADYDTTEDYTNGLNCDVATSTANTRICDEVKSKFFNIGDLSRSTITINHLDNSKGDPVISIGIELAYQPITPGLGLIGDFPMNVDSQMLLTPLARGK